MALPISHAPSSPCSLESNIRPIRVAAKSAIDRVMKAAGPVAAAQLMALEMAKCLQEKCHHASRGQTSFNGNLFLNYELVHMRNGN